MESNSVYENNKINANQIHRFKNIKKSIRKTLVFNRKLFVLTLLTTGKPFPPARLNGEPTLPAVASKVGMSFNKSLLLKRKKVKENKYI